MEGSNALQLVPESPLKDGPIAVFDSGVGGLSVVRELRRRLPHETLVYFGDTARVPYGHKSPDTVLQFSREILAFLMRLRPKCVVVACNTVSAVALPQLEAEIPVPVIGVVQPGAAAAVRALRGGQVIAVLATSATVAANAYPQAIGRLDPSVIVVQKACPLLVPLVEDGRDSDDPLVQAAVAQYLEPIAWLKPRVVVLGCTHYPMLRPALDRCLNQEATLIDSGESTAEQVEVTLAEHRTLSTSPTPGKLLCYVSDNPQHFQNLGSRFLGEPIPGVVCLSPGEGWMPAQPARPVRVAAV